MLVRKTSSGIPRSSPEARAAWLRDVGGAEAAAASGLLSEVVELPLVEALLIGLMRQGVTKYLVLFGHGSTAVAEMLHIYESHGLVRCWQFRNEVDAAQEKRLRQIA
jgi:3D-(3,5/4)-trihydroxycyclohexane-1,2-dione acylhydrolase (decyclizing)